MLQGPTPKPHHSTPHPQREEMFTREEARGIMREIIDACKARGVNVLKDDEEAEGDWHTLELGNRTVDLYFQHEDIFWDGSPSLTDRGSIQVESEDDTSIGCGFGKMLGMPGEEVFVTSEIILRDSCGAFPYLFGEG